MVMRYSAGIFCALLFAIPVAAEEQIFDCLIEPQITMQIGSAAQGILEEIPVRRGDRVSQGEVIARLESDLESTAVEMARTRLGYLEGQYNRLSIVKGKALASDEIVDAARSEMDTARLEVKRRELLYQQRFIKSPVNAIVVKRLLAPGEYVYEQTPVISLAKTDVLNVEVLVPTRLYGDIFEGMRATVMPEQPEGTRYEATVDVYDKVMDAASSTFGVRLALPNPELEIPAGLKCGVIFDFKDT